MRQICKLKRESCYNELNISLGKQEKDVCEHAKKPFFSL